MEDVNSIFPNFSWQEKIPSLFLSSLSIMHRHRIKSTLDYFEDYLSNFSILNTMYKINPLDPFSNLQASEYHQHN